MKKLLTTLILFFCITLQGFGQSANAYINVCHGLIAAHPKQVKITAKEATPSYYQAMQNRALADSLVGYTQWLIKNMIKRVEGDNAAKVILGDSIAFESMADVMNYDVPTDYMLGSTDAPGAAYSLKNRLSAFQTNCIEAFGTDTLAYKDKFSVNIAFTPDPADPETKSWEEKYFYYTPFVVAVMHLLKIENDVRRDNALVTEYLNKKTGN